jgi:2-polyprenyl-3-methyl-5-hydroxy-6-metoxy-1,4-benzoquinol methylase
LTGESNRWLQDRTVSGDAYDARYERRAAAGEDVHGEAEFVLRFAPASVLDAGCGTGRVGRELARRGIDVVGVDIDPEMLDTARGAWLRLAPRRPRGR